MKFILGTKEYMSQVFNEEGHVIPVTVVKAGPVVVTQVKSTDKDGYNAVQVGFGAKKAKNISKSLRGHIKELGNFTTLREFRVEGAATQKLGDSIDVSTFQVGDPIVVSAISKGKGFQGVVKRHGFGGGRRTHGQKHSEREPGAIGGAGRAGGRVAKGMRMAGRMGGDRVTVKNLTVAEVKPDTGLIYISGAIPGRRGTLVEVISR